MRNKKCKHFGWKASCNKSLARPRQRWYDLYITCVDLKERGTSLWIEVLVIVNMSQVIIMKEFIT